MLQGSLALSNKNPPNFSLQSIYHNGTQFTEGTAMLMIWKDNAGAMQSMGRIGITDSIAAKIEAYFPNE